jgi:hypothetical protein
MNAIPFDTLKMARKLEAAGFPGPQAAGAAEAMAEAMSGAELATKADLFAVKGDLERAIGSVRTDLERAIGSVRTDLERAIGSVRTDLEREVGSVRIDLERELGSVRAEMKHGFDLARGDLEREIGSVRTDMTAMETRLSVVITKVSGDVEILRRDMTIRLGAFAVASTGIILAAMRFMLTHQ